MQNKIIKNINSKESDKIISYCLERDMEVFQAEGTLLDNYLIDNSDLEITIGKNRPRKYIIIKERYLNEWNSRLELILTDDEEEYNNFMKIYYEMEN